jgi:hypothetical protein
VADTEDDDVIVTDADQVDDDEPEGSDALGDAGKKALDVMKAKWQKERDERKALAAQLADLQKSDKGDGKPDLDAQKLRDEAKAEARAEALRDRVLDKIEAKAAKLFADPEDAVALLGRRVDDFIDDGQLDVDAIGEALGELLKKKPHLAAAQSGKRFNGSADGGARKGSGRPAQLTEQDLKRMTPQQIVDAQSKGQFDDLLGVAP